ncbi:MAG: hypothetical protein WC488_03840 [Candidatus Micrarchaeia archaeon]
MARKSRGFFFVLISFILILYIFVYLTAWINASEVAERTSSERFRAASIEGIVYQLSQEKFSDFFDGAGYYALFKINDHASDQAHTLKYDSSDEVHYLRRAFISLVEHGNSSDFEGAPLAYSGSEADTYTFDAFLRNLNATLAPAGLHVTSFRISDEDLEQVDPVKFTGSLTLDLTVEDSLSTISITRKFSLRRTFEVTGFPDPMIKRESKRLHIAGLDPARGVERQIYYSPDYEPSDLKPVLRDEETQGQGFFYGPMVDVQGAPSIPTGQRGTYILVGSYNDVFPLPDRELFGAYILTTEPGTGGQTEGCPKDETDTFIALTYTKESNGDCKASFRDITYTDRPFVVIKDFDMNHYTEYNGTPHALLIANRTVNDVLAEPVRKNGVAEVYDIEDLRDATMCTYFINTDRSPSYPQRLTRYALTETSPNGLETFLVGTWAGGSDLPIYDRYSRVDFEFFKSVLDDNSKIRGMPGCKTFGMCSAEVGSNAPLGHFTLSRESIELYETQGIACTYGKAGCD